MNERVRITSTRELQGQVGDALTAAEALQQTSLAAHQLDEHDQRRWELHDGTRSAARELNLISRRLAALLESTPESEHAAGRTYLGTRVSRDGRQEVTVSLLDEKGRRETLPLPPPSGLWEQDGNTAPDWGYPGTAPALLAVALLTDATQDERYALRRHRDFMREVLEKLHASVWTMEGADIAAWAEDHP